MKHFSPIRLFLSCAFLLAASTPPASALPPAKGKNYNHPPGSRQRGRADFFYHRREDSDGTVPHGARARGLRQLRSSGVSALQQSGGVSPLGGAVPTPKISNAWSFIGPLPIKDNIYNGGDGIYGFGDASSKVNAIAVDLQNPNTVYMAAFSGIAKSTDGGINWNFVSDAMPSQSVQALAIDTTTPRVVYAGTGDPNFAGRGGSLSGVGVYRSLNGGASWTQHAGGETANDFAGCTVYKLAIDPRTTGGANNAETQTVLYAGVGSCSSSSASPGLGQFGVWKSVDSGQNWTLVHNNATTFDVAVGTAGTVFAANRNGLFKSTDGGTTWSDLAPTGSAGQASNNPNSNKNSVSVSGSTVIYTNSQSNGRAYKSVDGGETWSALPAANGFCGGQCFYDQYVAINPFDANQVYFGGVDCSSSSNGGATVVNFAPFVTPLVLHSDQHSYGFANAATTYLGNDGGIYKTVNAGLNWLNLNANIPGGLFMGVGRANDGTLIGGWQDNGTGRNIPGTDGKKWRVIYGGDGGYSKIDPGDSNKMYLTYIVVGTIGADVVFRSGNGGTAQTNIAPPAAVGVETSMFYPTLFMDPENYQKVILGLQNVWRSADSGDNWTRIGDLRTNDGNKILAVHEAPSNSNVLYAAVNTQEGTGVYRLYVSTTADSGTSAAWTLKNSGLPASQVPTAIAVHPTDPSTAYLTFAQFGKAAAPRLHIWKTTDQGTSWVGVSTGLPDVPFHDIVIDTAAPNNLFAASDIGVYNSIDGGKTWARSDVGMPEGSVVHALHFNAGTRKLVAGSYGRGAYELTVPPAPSVPIGLAGSAMGVSSVNWTWNANAGAENVQSYGLYDPAAPTVLVGSVTTGTSRIFTGLTPNTTYNLQITAANGVLESADTAAVSTVTHAQKLSGPFLNPEKVFESSVTVTSLNSGAPANPAGTLYETQFSTDSFATLAFSSFTFGQLASTFTALQANTTFQIRVRARNHGGHPSDFDLTVTTATSAAAPAASAPTGVGSSSITANWGANGNGLATTYECELSTDSFATVNASSFTKNSFATFTGLASGTNFQSRVRALGHNGRNSAKTGLPQATTATSGGGAAAAPGAGSPVFSGVSKASVTVTWTDGGNPSGTLYRAQISTAADFGTINFSSDTRNLSVTFGNGGAGNDLGQNVTYYFQVQASTGTGPSAFVNLGSTSTLAADPAGSAVQVWISSLAYAWAANGNSAGTTYYAQLSTAADFSTLNIDAGVSNSSILGGLSTSVVQAGSLGTSVVFVNLGINTTYYLRVKAVNRNAVPSLFDAFGGTATLAAAPVSPSLSVFITSTAFSWGANSNPSGTIFEAAVSTDNFGTMNSVKRLTAATTDFTGLSPNTTYFYQVRSRNLGDTPTEVAAANAATLAYPPVVSSATVFFSSAVLSWSANSNIAGTTYYVELSTNAAFATLTVSGNDRETSVLADGLSSNTTYYARVRAFNRSGTNTSFSTLAATSTLAALPTSANPVTVASSSIKAAWGANGNSLTTQYEAQASSDAYVTVNSSKTLNAFATFEGLPANTSFASRVRAYGNDGSVNSFVNLPTTTTLLSAPTQAAVTFGGLGTGVVTVSWAAGGNGAGTEYQAQSSTNAFSTVNFTSRTFNTSVTFGTGGAGSSLSPNTSYFFQVRSSATPNLSDYLSLGTTVTFAAAPTGTTVLSVTSTTAVAYWSSNSNPNGTTYYAQISTDAFSTLVLTNGVIGTAALVPSTFTGLTAGTAYAIRVRAINHPGTPTAFDSTVSTTTNPQAPGVPGTPAGTVLGHSSISWTWSAASSALTYNVYRASNPATLLSSQAGLTFANTGLSTNTAYAVKVAGVNGSGESSLATSTTLYTLALPPNGTSVPTATIFPTSATITWAQTVNSNPGTTLSYVFLKSSNTAAYAEISSSTVQLSTATGLIGCTLYTAMVQNANGDGIRTSSDSAVNFTTKGTTPAAPGSLTANSLTGSQVGLNWVASGTEGIADYLVYTDSGTGTVSFTTGLLAVVPYTQTSYTTGVLTSSAAYKYTVRARHRCGVEEKTGASAAAGVAATLSDVRAALDAPESGDEIAGDTGSNNAQVTVSASIVAGDTDSVKHVQFEYKASNSNTWLLMTSADATNRPNPATEEPFSIPWDLSGLAWVSYDLRAVAVDVNDSTDTTPGSITVSVDDPSTATESETVDSEGEVTKVETIDNTVDSNVATSATRSDGVAQEANVQFPAGAFGSETNVRITVIPVPSSAPAIPATLGASAGIFAEIAASKPLTGTADITMSYPDKNDDGYLDGTAIRADSLKMYSFIGGAWTPDVPTTIDAANKTLRGVASHFTFFGAFAAPSANLDRVRVYPNPFRPNSGNANEGRPCGTTCAAGQGIVFDQLTNEVTIDIFTAAGQRVEKITTARSGGTLQWNARNSAGKDVATGGYFAVITSPGFKRVIKRFVILR